MKSPHTLLIEKFQKATHDAFPALTDLNIEVVQSTQKKFGDYQFNSAMKLAKTLQQNPRHVAEEIIKHLNKNDADNNLMIAKLEIAGPGFINITLDPQYIQARVQEILHSPKLGIDFPQKQRIIVDLSSPNTAKEMHVGHLRSTIIGDCLARLFEFLGHDVLRLNHIGDWGTSFGMLIAYIKENAPQILNKDQTTTLTDLVTLYRQSKKSFDADPDFKKRAQLEVVALQKGDKAALDAWKIICDISLEGFQEIYDLLDVKIINRGESFYNSQLASLVEELEKNGHIQISDGAKCIFLEGFQNREGELLPLMIQKSDGGYNYDTTDLAAIKHRIEVEKADRILYVVDAGQSTHFQMVFKAAEKVGYLNSEKVLVEHVPFGLVLGLDGKKFRTRSGETERLIDLLTTAIEKADQILLEKNPDLYVPAGSISETERKQLAKTLGIGAIKYADLSCNRTGDYVFSYDRMLRFEGNTAAFLMYAYVRVLGIKRRTHADIEKLLKEEKILLKEPTELALGLQLIQFGETLEQLSRDLLPNRLSEYLYTLAEKFNAFFRDCRVEGTPQQNSRLLLCEVVARTLKQGLEILGVQTVDRM